MEEGEISDDGNFMSGNAEYSEVPLGKWDDSTLIETWDNALEEYNVYHI